MERAVSKKKLPPPAGEPVHVAGPKFAAKQEPKQDPGNRPQYTLDGYDKPQQVKAIRVLPLKVWVRIKTHHDGTTVRLYYVGAIIVGTITCGPMHHTAKFNHVYGEREEVWSYDNLRDAEDYLSRLLMKELA